MTTIYATIPAHTATAHGFGREAATVTRVRAGTPGAVKLPLWLRAGDRAPRCGEVVGTYRDATTLYAVGIRR